MQLLHGSAHAIDLPAGSVQCVVTSPPYWGLRSYAGEQAVEWPAVSYAPMPGLPELSIPAQTCGLGLEPDLNAYIGHLVLCLREWRRVLRDDGVIFCNLGDSYANNPGNGRGGGEKVEGGIPHYSASAKTGLPAKNLCGIPWRFAFAAQADGFYLRSDIIWHKPNPMPESVTDRPTRSHEYIFMLAKSQRYYWDADAVREANSPTSQMGGRFVGDKKSEHTGNGHSGLKVEDNTWSGRNLRSVWTIATQPFAGSHFATFPERIPELCIRAGTSARGCCPTCGAPWVRVVEQETPPRIDRLAPKSKLPGNDSASAAVRKDGDYLNGPEMTKWRSEHPSLESWRPGCDHGHEPVPCTVLDPFHGSGTTGKVALRLGREYCGVDISDEYLTTVTDARFADGVQIEMNL